MPDGCPGVYASLPSAWLNISLSNQETMENLQTQTGVFFSLLILAGAILFWSDSDVLHSVGGHFAHTILAALVLFFILQLPIQ